MLDNQMFYQPYGVGNGPKKCVKCKSRKFKAGTTNDTQSEAGATLLRRVPKWTCKKCRQIHVGIHHMICEDALDRWFDNDEPEMRMH